MSQKSSRMSYRARRKRRNRIILVVCLIAAFCLVSACLLFLLNNREKDSTKKPAETTPAASTAATSAANGETTEPSEAATTDAPVETTASVGPLTIEDVWANDTRTPVKAKGAYLSATKAANPTAMQTIINLLDTTEVNAVVIDIKDDEGYLTVDLGIDLATKVGATDPEKCIFTIDQMKSVMQTLRDHGAYLIARIACFRDNVLTQADYSYSLHWKPYYGSQVYCDTQGYYWLDPGNETVRNYLLEISQAAVDLGFDEIQYDYIRFPTTYIGRVDYYGGEGEKSGYYLADGTTYNTAAAELRMSTISSYVEFVCRALVPQGVFVAADVYGTIIGKYEDAGNVGQDYAELSHWLDYICPMVYPSHYTDPVYGVTYPDTDPYTVVKGALADSVEQLSTLAGEHCAVVRPWMQCFTAKWLAHYIDYGGTELRLQIDAVYANGYEEWILWNSSAAYNTFLSGLKSK